LSRIDLPHADLLVLGQGGRVVDLRSDTPKILRDARLPGSVVANVIEQLESHLGPVKLIIEALDGEGEPLWGDATDEWPYPDDLLIKDRDWSLQYDVIKAFIRTATGDSDALLGEAKDIIIPGVAEVTHAGLGWVEITPPNVDKGTGLAVAAAALGVKPEEVLVFGDMPNDIPMFQWAGWRRVAVENAHPALAAIADEITFSVERDGVAVYLDDLLKRAG
jgi:hydroxymethylpyrimidine pyrophosphatase-like HAD family hydrolase